MVTKTRTLLVYSLIPIIVLLFSSCTFRMLAAFDQEVMDEFIAVHKKIELLYLKLQDVPKEERTYVTFRNDYLEIESSLQNLVVINGMRKKNEETTKQCEIALKLWQDDRKKHKEKDFVSDFIIKKHREQFQRVFIALIKGEQAK